MIQVYEISFLTHIIKLKYVAQIVTGVGVKAYNPYSITFLTRTPIFEWYVALRTEIKKRCFQVRLDYKSS